MPDKRAEKKVIVFPEGRLINQSLFQKDTFDEKAVPSYKVEIAFDREALDAVEDALAEEAIAKWGAGADRDYFESRIISPVLDGDKLARRREEKDKPGDSYKDKDVVRAHTIFNCQGQDGPGGIQVFGPDAEEITVVRSNEVYPGCYGKMAATIGTYTESRTGEHALMFYLCAFQKTRDGEPLISARDHKSLFEATTGSKPGDGQRRRRARGE